MLFMGCAGNVVSSEVVSVIPEPAFMEVGEGTFRLTPKTQANFLFEAPEMEYVASALADMTSDVFGEAIKMNLSSLDATHGINFILDETIPEEGYRMEVVAETIDIASSGAAGAFYALQTLRQLMSAEAFTAEDVRTVEIPAVRIEDAPMLGYRGTMLDVGRYFFPVEDVKNVLDIMAMHKLNTFHWHLTEDQGWRIQIDKYPRLTEVGSMRKRTIIGKDPNGEYDENTPFDTIPHGGFYTKDQIREVVQYAAERFITVIPEIEFPGHSLAALASYPWLGCTGEQYEVRQSWDIEDRVFCPGKETTFEFLEGVLEEVVELFPSEYIHIGGDECPTKYWQKCPHCAKRMKEEGLKTYRQLQGYGIARVEKFLESHGKHLIGWDEILEAGVTPNSIVMSWRGTEGGIKAAKQGNRAIMAPSTYCYFDYYQSKDRENEPLAWGGYLPLEKVWSFNPYEGLAESEKQYILGVQANLWTEYIPHIEQAEYMLLPRLAALCEIAWTAERGTYDDFLTRLPAVEAMYDAFDYNHRQHPQNR
jgi:hexosaminidase